MNDNATPGAILRTLVERAQTRDTIAVTGLANATDSDGAAWPTTPTRTYGSGRA